MNTLHTPTFTEFEQEIESFMYEDLSLLPVWYGH